MGGGSDEQPHDEAKDACGDAGGWVGKGGDRGGTQRRSEDENGIRIGNGAVSVGGSTDGGGLLCGKVRVLREIGCTQVEGLHTAGWSCTAWRGEANRFERVGACGVKGVWEQRRAEAKSNVDGR